jgi:uncharacterized membrane protein
VAGAMELSAWMTVAMAMGSAAGRAALNVIDRKAFNHLRIPVLAGSAVNNIAPALIALILVRFFNGPLFLDALLDWRVCIFAGIAQGIAVLYGCAFRAAPVPRVVLFSKLPDVAIPLGLFLSTGAFEWSNYVYSVGTVIVCAPVILETAKKKATSYWPLWLIALGILIQASAAPLLVVTWERSTENLIAFTAAVLQWRLALSILMCAGTGISSSIRDAIVQLQIHGASTSVMLLRGVITIVTQASFILAISIGDPGVAWPVLNATALFAVVLSARVLGEKATRSETVSAVLVLVVAACRAIRS